jgi:integrase
MAKRSGQLAGSIFLRSPERTTWYFQIRTGDGHLKRRIGLAWKGSGRPPEGYFTATMAREVLEKNLVKYANISRGSNPSFSVAAAEYLGYLERHQGLRASTLRRYSSIIERDLLPALGERQLSTIGPRDIMAIRNEMISRPAYRRGAKPGDQPTQLSASTLNQTRTMLVGIYKFAKKARGYSGPDPTVEFEHSRIKPQSHIDVYSPAEVLALARAAADEQDAAIYLVAALAGLRRSELRALRWRDIDFVKSTIFVRGGYTDEGSFGRTKSGRGRSVPLVPQAAQALENLSRREYFTEVDWLVFCNPVGGVIDGSALYKRYLGAAERAGLRRLRFHDLRHTAICMWVQIWPLSDVMAYAGHASVSTTMIYVHHKPHTQAAEQLGALIDREVNPMSEPIMLPDEERFKHLTQRERDLLAQLGSEAEVEP